MASMPAGIHGPSFRRPTLQRLPLAIQCISNATAQVAELQNMEIYVNICAEEAEIERNLVLAESYRRRLAINGERQEPGGAEEGGKTTKPDELVAIYDKARGRLAQKVPIWSSSATGGVNNVMLSTLTSNVEQFYAIPRVVESHFNAVTSRFVGVRGQLSLVQLSRAILVDLVENIHHADSFVADVII